MEKRYKFPICSLSLAGVVFVNLEVSDAFEFKGDPEADQVGVYIASSTAATEPGVLYVQNAVSGQLVKVRLQSEYRVVVKL